MYFAYFYSVVYIHIFVTAIMTALYEYEQINQHVTVNSVQCLPTHTKPI